jgi:hypothetical protein
MIEPSIEREVSATEEQTTTNPLSSPAMPTAEEADAAITATVAEEGLDQNEPDGDADEDQLADEGDDDADVVEPPRLAGIN